MGNRRAGKVRAFFVGLIVWLVVSLLARSVVGLIIGFVAGPTDNDESLDNFRQVMGTLIFLLSIGAGVGAGQRYLRRYHPEPASPPIHNDDGRTAMSELADGDMRRTRDTALRLAESTLRQRGELVPFAVIVSSDGKASIPRLVARSVEGIYQELRSRTADLRCAAVVSASDDGQSMVVHIEHREGHPVALRVPYSGRQRKIVLGSPAEQPGAIRQLWPEDVPH